MIGVANGWGSSKLRLVMHGCGEDSDWMIEGARGGGCLHCRAQPPLLGSPSMTSWRPHNYPSSATGASRMPGFRAFTIRSVAARKYLFNTRNYVLWWH